MKRFLLFLALILSINGVVLAADVTITVSSFVYTPDNITVNVGDRVIFNGSFNAHPTVQVDQSTWAADGNTPLPGGFSYTTGSSATLTITPGMSGSTLYYVCSPHVTIGMKGRINVNVIASLSENNARDFNFTVFPNPVTKNSFLNISTKKAGRISLTLYDIQGRIVKQVADMNVQAGELNIKFDAANLQKGNYVLLMRSNEGTMRRQIVVQ